MEETQIMETKMREPVGVSVSFGKYESDALCWEKWSTFSPNKYLEEVGKCSTPGSVAQKKAFFEAHYKKIAAMKAEAELLDREKAAETDPLRSDDHSFEEIKEQHEDCAEIKVCLNEEQQMDAQISAVDGSGTVEEDKPDDEADEPESRLLLPSESSIEVISNVNKLEEAVLVNDESMKLVKQHFDVDLETETIQEHKPEIRKPKAQDVVKKINPTKVEKNSMVTKKKEASFTAKLPETSSTRSPKPKPNPKATPAPSSKKANASSLSRNKNHSTPMSLHLSMSMSSVNSDTASSVTSSRRRSLFMEQMGDKDIVKRAFKTFQNRVNQLPSSATEPNNLQTKTSEPKASNSMAYQKENERSRKMVEKINPARGQFGPTWKSVSLGSFRGVGSDERKLKAGPASGTSKSSERAERRKEFMRELEEKSNARELERSQLSSNSKEVKDVETKKSRQNLNFKAKPIPSFYRSQGVSKSTPEKEAKKTGATRRADSHR